VLAGDRQPEVAPKRVGRRHPIAAGIGAGLPTGSAPPRPPPSMSPTHANKLSVRYPYYVSHAILQNRKAEAGSIALDIPIAQREPEVEPDSR